MWRSINVTRYSFWRTGQRRNCSSSFETLGDWLLYGAWNVQSPNGLSIVWSADDCLTPCLGRANKGDWPWYVQLRSWIWFNIERSQYVYFYIRESKFSPIRCLYEIDWLSVWYFTSYRQFLRRGINIKWESDFYW